jgi:peptidoglycan LD-endopeptidase LytH
MKNNRIRRKIILRVLYVSSIIVLVGFLIPQDFVIPVENCRPANWDTESFWYYPWGESIVHKGVDIFSPKGTNVFSSTCGFVLSVERTRNGGNITYHPWPKMAHALLCTHG